MGGSLGGLTHPKETGQNTAERPVLPRCYNALLVATGHSGYGNVYPADITKALEPIAWEARFGQTYTIAITGDRTNGYQAVLHP